VRKSILYYKYYRNLWFWASLS